MIIIPFEEGTVCVIFQTTGRKIVIAPEEYLELQQTTLPGLFEGEEVNGNYKV